MSVNAAFENGSIRTVELLQRKVCQEFHYYSEAVKQTCANSMSCCVRGLYVFICLFSILLPPSVHALLLLETDTLWDGAAPELALASIMLNGKELNSDAMVAFAPGSGETYVNLAEFTAALELELRQEKNRFVIVTPIGEAKLELHLLRPLDDSYMVSLEALGRHLASDILFSQGEFAIMVHVPWSLDKPPPQAEIIRPSSDSADALGAPKASLSFIRTDYLQRIEKGDDTSSILTDVGGRLLNGYWQVRVRDYLENDPFIEDYIWLQTGQRHRFLLGNQNIGLDSLLQGFEFTGAQAAWTNRPISLFTDQLQAEQLIGNQTGSVRSFVGEGPAGGRAELRIEGNPVASTVISLDGRFEFLDVEVPSGNVVRIEVWVYERGGGGVPHEILDFSGYNTNRVLPGRTLLFRGGIGVDGNIIENNLGSQQEAGFFQTRYAPNDHLTLEGSYQHVLGNDAGLTGASVNLDRLGFLTGRVAYTGGQQAWRLEADNRQQHVFWRGFIQHQPDDWFGREGDLDDVFAEVGYRFSPQWQVSLVGRDFETDDESFDFLLPAAEWRPSQDLILTVRPDFDGDYTGQAYWRVAPGHNLNAVVNESESSVQWLHNVNQRDNLIVQALDREDLGQRISAIYRHSSNGLRSLGWGLGLLAGEGTVGYLAQANYEFIPGLQGRMEVFRDPFSGINDEANTVISLGIVANFNLSGGRITRGSFRRALLDRGTISGSIQVPQAFAGHFELSDVAIAINNQVRTRTEDGGRFSIPYLQPGVYRVQLDFDGLPLELRPKESGFWVEVAAGAASYVQFKTEVLLGFAGQVTSSDGCALGKRRLEVLNKNGETVGAVKTNDFGFYRIDGLAPDTYQIRLVENPEITRTVSLETDFRFNQNLMTQQNLGCESAIKQ